MQGTRRNALKTIAGMSVYGALVSSGLIAPGMLKAAEERQLFKATNLGDALAALGATESSPSTDLHLTVPDIAEDSAVVPVAIVSGIPDTEQIAIMVEKNPNMVVANFTLGARTLPEIATRIKMGQTSDVYAVVKANGRFYFARKEIRITIGGCGA